MRKILGRIAKNRATGEGGNYKAEDRSEGFPISRRAFLGITAGAAAAFGAAYAFEWPSFAFPSDPAGYVEGIGAEEWVPTSCLNCPTRCAVSVRKIQQENDSTWHAVRIVGNPKSTYSDGKTCPRSHIGLQILYNPKRFQTKPLKRKVGAEKGLVPGSDALKSLEECFEETTWDEALEEIAGRLNGLSGHPEKLIVVAGLNTTSDNDLVQRFARAFGTPNLLAEDSLELAADSEGKFLAVGRRDSGYDLEKTRYVLAFGADIIEYERPLARNLRAWGKIRRENPNRAKIVTISPRYSVTAAKADEWIPIKPGAEGALAMAMAHVIVTEGLYDADFINNWTSGFAAYRTLVSSNKFKPAAVAEVTGIPAETTRRLAREFAQTSPAMAWSGLAATGLPYGTYASHAIYCLNALVGGIDAPGGILYQDEPLYQDMPPVTGPDPSMSYRDFVQQVFPQAEPATVVIGLNGNLVMSVPQRSEWNGTLAKLPYYVHVGPAWNEMAAYADIILPASTYLEEWGYETAIPGSGYAEVRIKQPVISPRFNSRPTAQILFDLAARVDSAKDAFKNIGGGPEGFAEYRTQPLAAWSVFKKDGVWVGPSYVYAKDDPAKYNQLFGTASGKFEFHVQNLDAVLDVDSGSAGPVDYKLKLAPYSPVLDIRDGNQNYPWAQEIYLVMAGRGWDNFVELGAETAHDHHIGDGDKVWVESGGGAVEAKANVVEGMRPGVVAIALGQGHYACGEWADGIGVNALDVVALERGGGFNCDDVSGQPCFSNTRVNIRKA